MSKNWKTVEVGNWYTEYQCTDCGKRVVKDDEELYNIDEVDCSQFSRRENPGE